MGYDTTRTQLRKNFQKHQTLIHDLTAEQRRVLERHVPDDIPLVEEAIKFAKSLREDTLDSSPSELGSNAIRRLADLQEILAEIMSSHDRGATDVLITKIRDLQARFGTAVSAWGPILATCEYTSRGAILQSSVHEAEVRTARIKQIEGAATGMLKAIEEASKKFGSAKFAVKFFEEAEAYRRTSVYWFLGILALVLGGYYVVWKLFAEHPLTGADLSAILSSAGMKLFVVATFFVLLSLFVKNYSAARHNSVINKHRALALQTFETFTEAAKGDTKDAILRAATDAIFSVQKTGYIPKEAAPSGLSNVTELIHRASTTRAE